MVSGGGSDGGGSDGGGWCGGSCRVRRGGHTFSLSSLYLLA